MVYKGELINIMSLSKYISILLYLVEMVRSHQTFDCNQSTKLLTMYIDIDKAN